MVKGPRDGTLNSPQKPRARPTVKNSADPVMERFNVIFKDPLRATELVDSVRPTLPSQKTKESNQGDEDNGNDTEIDIEGPDDNSSNEHRNKVVNHGKKLKHSLNSGNTSARMTPSRNYHKSPFRLQYLEFRGTDSSLEQNRELVFLTALYIQDRLRLKLQQLFASPRNSKMIWSRSGIFRGMATDVSQSEPTLEGVSDWVLSRLFEHLVKVYQELEDEMLLRTSKRSRRMNPSESVWKPTSFSELARNLREMFAQGVQIKAEHALSMREKAKADLVQSQPYRPRRQQEPQLQPPRQRRPGRALQTQSDEDEVEMQRVQKRTAEEQQYGEEDELEQTARTSVNAIAPPLSVARTVAHAVPSLETSGLESAMAQSATAPAENTTAGNRLVNPKQSYLAFSSFSNLPRLSLADPLSLPWATSPKPSESITKSLSSKRPLPRSDSSVPALTTRISTPAMSTSTSRSTEPILTGASAASQENDLRLESSEVVVPVNTTSLWPPSPSTSLTFGPNDDDPAADRNDYNSSNNKLGVHSIGRSDSHCRYSSGSSSSSNNIHYSKSRRSRKRLRRSRSSAEHPLEEEDHYDYDQDHGGEEEDDGGIDDKDAGAEYDDRGEHFQVEKLKDRTNRHGKQIRGAHKEIRELKRQVQTLTGALSAQEEIVERQRQVLQRQEQMLEQQSRTMELQRQGMEQHGQKIKNHEQLLEDQDRFNNYVNLRLQLQQLDLEGTRKAAFNLKPGYG
ncbi:hypothetical protein EDD11_004326 [Mortierella claussenii]|nr:hypothetical protein EDD11_004326 [Mortierella claussenii]